MRYKILLVPMLFLLPLLAAHAQFRGPKVKDAKPGEIRVIATAAVREPVNAVVKQAEKVIGKPILVEYGASRGNLKSEILAGQEFEVAILVPDVNADLLRAGRIRPDTYEIARDPIALGLRGDVRPVDVSTPAAIKAAFLKSKSIRYSPIGVGEPTARKILASLHIADKVHDNSHIRGLVPLGAGEYEINIYPISEIIPNKKLRNLGPVIPQFQVPGIIEASIGKNSKDPKASLALIRFLQGPAMDAALKAEGITKPR